MKFRKVVLRLMAGIAPLIAALAMAAPQSTLAAAPTILVDADNPATNCGSFTGKASGSNPAMAINGAATGSTIIICPGTYNLNGEIGIGNKKLTIKRALTGPGSRPILVAHNTSDRVFTITDSNVTIDGLVIDGRLNAAGYRAITLTRSSAAIKNVTLIASDGSEGIVADATGQTKTLTLSISASNLVGYNFGVFVEGPIKFKVTGSTFDGNDGGRVTPFANQTAIRYAPGSSGMVSKSRFVNNVTGVHIGGTSKVSISSNIFFNNVRSVLINLGSTPLGNAESNKITGNTIMGVPQTGVGIQIENSNVAANTIENTLISKNLISAAHYNGGILPPTAILVEADALATTTVMAVISGNTLLGFPTGSRIVTFFAIVTEKGNDATP